MAQLVLEDTLLIVKHGRHRPIALIARPSEFVVPGAVVFALLSRPSIRLEVQYGH